MESNIIDHLNAATLRPDSWREFVGQTAARAQFDVMIAAAQQRGSILDHLLLSGPSGLGKTTLSRLAAGAMGGRLHTATGPGLGDPLDLCAVLTGLDDGDVLFLDEIHALPVRLQESLYPAMEDRQLHILTGSGSNVRTLTIGLASFTLIGATTRAGSLNKPLRDRFVHEVHLDYYAVEELSEIIVAAEPKLSMRLDAGGRLALAKVSRGVPRIALRYLRQIRDFVQLAGAGDEGTVRRALESIGLGRYGESWLERSILEALCGKLADRPVGLGTLAAVTQQSPDDVEQAEVYLMELGFMARTGQGRTALGKGVSYVRSLREAEVFEGVEL